MERSSLSEVAAGTLETIQQATSLNENGMNLAKTPSCLQTVLNNLLVPGAHQGTNSSATGLPPTSNQTSAGQRQELGQAGGLRLDSAALQRVAQLALEELARRERQE